MTRENTTHVGIWFPISGTDQRKRQKIMEASGILREAGIKFDESFSGDEIEWSFDWSLKGAYVELREVTGKDQSVVDGIIEEINNAGKSLALALELTEDKLNSPAGFGTENEGEMWEAVLRQSKNALYQIQLALDRLMITHSGPR